MNNNILEITKDDNNKNNIVNNIESNNNSKNENNDNEGIPILSQFEISSPSSVEYFYKTNYPEYKIIKFKNIIFIKMGRLLAFNFDKNNNYVPKYSIGPHWYLTLTLLFIILSLALLLYSSIFKKLSNVKQIIFYLFVLSVYYFVLKTALVHPQAVMNKKKTFNEYGFCTFCQCYFNPYNKVEHCSDCGLCFEKMDHHCVWVGKCVAKNNTRSFYAMLIDVGIFYVYIIYCVIAMTLEKKNRINNIKKM